MKQVISRQIAVGSQLVIALDRTQWKEYNVLMVSAIIQKRAFPLFWTLLDKQALHSCGMLKRTVKKYPAMIYDLS